MRSINILLTYLLTCQMHCGFVDLTSVALYLKARCIISWKDAGFYGLCITLDVYNIVNHPISRYPFTYKY